MGNPECFSLTGFEIPVPRSRASSMARRFEDRNPSSCEVDGVRSAFRIAGFSQFYVLCTHHSVLCFSETALFEPPRPPGRTKYASTIAIAFGKMALERIPATSKQRIRSAHSQLETRPPFFARLAMRKKTTFASPENRAARMRIRTMKSIASPDVVSCAWMSTFD
jgi:hypothetical protein